MLDRALTIEKLKSSERYLSDHFGVSSMLLFGSLARNEQKEDSDVDSRFQMLATCQTIKSVSLQQLWVVVLLRCSIRISTSRNIKRTTTSGGLRLPETTMVKILMVASSRWPRRPRRQVSSRASCCTRAAQTVATPTGLAIPSNETAVPESVLAVLVAGNSCLSKGSPIPPSPLFTGVLVWGTYSEVPHRFPTTSPF